MIATAIVALEISPAGFRASAESVLGFGLGPLSLPLAVVIVLLAMWVIQQYLRELDADADPTLFGGGGRR